MGDKLLITYTARHIPLKAQAQPLATEDSYDTPSCTSGGDVTWIELWDPRAGKRTAIKALPQYAASSSLDQADGKIILGGSWRAKCSAEAHAVVMEVDADLGVRPLFKDEGVGSSEVWSLSALPDGRIFVAASKENVLGYEFADLDALKTTNPNTPRSDLQRYHSAMLFTVGRNGTFSTPTMLDAGSSLYVNGADASDPADIVVGGAIGGTAAIFHLNGFRPASAP